LDVFVWFHSASKAARGHEIVRVLRHHFTDACLLLALHVASTKVLIGASVASFACWHTVAIRNKGFHPFSVKQRVFVVSAANHTVAIVASLAFVEVLSSVGR
jgi:hypothetical protein